MTVMNRVSEMLAACDTEATSLPPTQLYNEGWLTRLILDWYSRNRSPQRLFAFAPGATWYSEALLPSRFLRSSRREGYTHADAVIGHFKLREKRGDVTLRPDGTQFHVFEAKMGSPLSGGVKYAPRFNQAARNVACMVHLVGTAKSLNAIDLAFFVLAPQQRIDEGSFTEALDKANLRSAIRERDQASEHLAWCDDYVDVVVEAMRVESVPWENPLREIRDVDPEYGAALWEFYRGCCKHNGLRCPVAA